MTRPEILLSPASVPLGAHCLSLHATRREAEDQAIAFLEGTPEGQDARYWVSDATTEQLYSEEVRDRIPAHVGCIAVLPGEQVVTRDGKLRPADEVQAFIATHPEGVTAAADTISAYWTPETLPAHLEYESWFERQPRLGSRFLCPYDLRTVPPSMGAQVMGALGSLHSHVVLSSSVGSGARLLQLFVFGSVDRLPSSLRTTLEWATQRGFVRTESPDRRLSLTDEGVATIRGWSDRARLES